VALLVFYEIDKRAETRRTGSPAASPLRRRLRNSKMTTMIDLSAGEDGRAREARLAQLATHAISQPLVTHIYTADPSAHVFEGACTSIRRTTSTAGSRSTMRAAISACRITMCCGWIRPTAPPSIAAALHVRRGLGPQADVGA
jgi:hypothetical protein